MGWTIRSSNPGRDKGFFPSSNQSIQIPMYWVPGGHFSCSKAAGAGSWFTSIYGRVWETAAARHLPKMPSWCKHEVGPSCNCSTLYCYR